jgi:tetratricopeptide (TPR) repeat protein
MCYFYMEDYDSALECVQESIKIDGKQPGPYYRMGYAYYYKEEYEESIKWYKKCL